MLLTSTFPDFSESEALRELVSNGGGDGNEAPFNTPLYCGRFAGWVSGLGVTNTTSTFNSNTYSSSRYSRASSSAVRCDSCPSDDAATTPGTRPSSSSSSPPSFSPPTVLTTNENGRDRSTKEATADQSSGGGGGGVGDVGRDSQVNLPTGNGVNSFARQHPPLSAVTQPNGGRSYSGGEVADAGEGAASLQQSCFSPAGLGEVRREGHVLEELLVATSKAVRRGDVVAVERPLIAAQSSRALPWVAACPGCLRHVGSLDVQLTIASGKLGRTEAFRVESEKAATGSTGAGPMSTSPGPTLPTAAAAAAAHRRQTVAGREEEGEQGGNGGGREGVESGTGAELPALEGLSERFVQVKIFLGNRARNALWARALVEMAPVLNSGGYLMVFFLSFRRGAGMWGPKCRFAGSA